MWGRAINPQLVKGQIIGGVVQALGHALMEDFKTSDGRVLTDRLSTYLIPTILDIPDSLDPMIVEVPDPNGPLWGAWSRRDAFLAGSGGHCCGR